MDPDTEVGYVITEERGTIVCHHDLNDETKALIEKGLRYDALKAHAEALADAVGKWHEEEGDPLAFHEEPMVDALVAYRDFIKQPEEP